MSIQKVLDVANNSKHLDKAEFQNVIVFIPTLLFAEVELYFLVCITCVS